MDTVDASPDLHATSHLSLSSCIDILGPSFSSATPISEDSSPPARHIRFTTPPSSLCPSSPNLSSSPGMSGRVETRVDSPPSALAFLAAVCSSPSIRWDGRKHHYLEEREKLIPCEDALADREVSDSAHVGAASLASTTAYGEHRIPFEHKVEEDVEGCEDSRTHHESFITHELHCSSEDNEDEDIPAPRNSAYFSEFTPSSPTALSLSSPSHRMSYDFSSSSERSATLPLSSPAPYLSKTLSSTAIYADGLSDNIRNTHVFPGKDFEQASLDIEVECLALKTEPLDMVVPKVERTEFRTNESEGRVLSGPGMQARSRSPLRAPSPPPSIYVDLAFSPLSSVLSSPPSEAFDLEPPSAISSHFSVSSSALSSRSVSPDVDMLDDNRFTKYIGAGRRASTHVIGSDTRRMNGDMSAMHRPRSDTAPPEPTPRKRQRRSSPSSPNLRAFQVQRVASSQSPSPCSRDTTTSSATHQENRLTGQKSKTKSKKATASTSTLYSKSNRMGANKHVPNTLPSCSKPEVSSSRSKRKPVSSVALSDSDTPAVKELATLPMTGFLVETLALSRASAMAAPELLRAVLKSQPHLMEERLEERWSVLVRQILERVRMFGRIERKGTDAADRPLEDQWFYIPENDEEDGRAELLKGLMPNKRSVTKRSKQYYYEPVQKVSRWDPEDD